MTNEKNVKSRTFFHSSFIISYFKEKRREISESIHKVNSNIHHQKSNIISNKKKAQLQLTFVSFLSSSWKFLNKTVFRVYIYIEEYFMKLSQKSLKTVLESSERSWGYHIFSKCQKMSSTWLKTPSKLKYFVKCFVVFIFLTLYTIRNVRLQF